MTSTCDHFYRKGIDLLKEFASNDRLKTANKLGSIVPAVLPVDVRLKLALAKTLELFRQRKVLLFKKDANHACRSSR